MAFRFASQNGRWANTQAKGAEATRREYRVGDRLVSMLFGCNQVQRVDTVPALLKPWRTSDGQECFLESSYPQRSFCNWADACLDCYVGERPSPPTTAGIICRIVSRKRLSLAG